MSELERKLYAPGVGAFAPPLDRLHRALVRSAAYQVLEGSALLDIQLRRFPEKLVIQIAGELSDAMCRPLAEALERALAGREPAMVLDLSRLDVIHPTGVHTILTAHLRASDEHKEFLIVPGPPAVQRLFDAIDGPFRYVG
jgi:anti-anti-sigma regulatory factor